MRALRVVLALLLAAPAGAADFGVKAIGTTGSPELTLPVGARAIAMGEAFTALAEDATAIHWNPGGLALVPEGSATFMHSAYIADINYDFLAYAQRISEHAVVAGSLHYVDYGNLSGRDVNNNPDGSFHPRTYVYSFGFAQVVPDVAEDSRVTAGVVIKHVRSEIKDSATANAADVGFQTLFEGDIPHRAGLVIQNMGQGTQYDAARDRLPLTVRGGLAMMPAPWTFSLDLVAPRGNQPYGAVGVEFAKDWTPQTGGALRAGYNSLTRVDGPDGFRGFSFGLGLTMKPLNLSFDYALAPFGDLGITHRLSFSYALPTSVEE